MDEVKLVEDSDGQLMFAFTPDMLSQMGWSEGDDLEWSIEDNGNVTLTKIND